jgi:hypothetical protein
LATALLVGMGSLACGGGDKTAEPAASAPSGGATAAAQATPTGTPVPDDISAEDLRKLVAAAAATVSDVTAEQYTVGRESYTFAYSRKRDGGFLSSFSVAPDDSFWGVVLNAGDRVDYLEAKGKAYYRLNGGAWVSDPNEPVSRVIKADFFPPWYQFVSAPVGGPITWVPKPVGTPASPSGETETYTLTATAMSASAPTTTATGRCWDLTVDQESAMNPPRPDRPVGVNVRHIFTVCEPHFLVIKDVGVLPNTLGSVEDNFRYDTGITLDAPQQVVEVHCPPYDAWSKERVACLFGQ